MSLLDTKDVKQEKRELAGISVDITKVPRPQRKDIVHDVGDSLKKLYEGLRLTLDYLSHPSKVVTQQYPENRETLKLPERFRSQLVMPTNEQGHHFCTTCGICEKICPNGSIILKTYKGEKTKKKELERFIWRMDSCTFCNNCVEACPFDALEMTQNFENAVYDRRLLIHTLNRYAGPHAKLLEKFDPEEQKELMRPIDPFGGPTPLGGVYMPKVKPLGADRAQSNSDDEEAQEGGES